MPDDDDLWTVRADVIRDVMLDLQSLPHTDQVAEAFINLGLPRAKSKSWALASCGCGASSRSSTPQGGQPTP
jgi:hypothetical protein